MHLCFVDESGTPAKPDKDTPKFFVFGGVIIPEEQWHKVRNKFIGLKRQKKYRGELKWRYFAPNNNDQSNPMRDWDMDRKNDFRAAVFKILTGNESLKIVCGVAESSVAYGLGNVNSQEDIYFRTYKVVTERFQYFLQDISKSSGRQTNGIIVSDHRNGHQDSRMRIQHEKLVRESANYTSTYSNFIESIFLAPSNMSIGIQLADMVAGAVWRYHEHDDSTWVEKIRPAFRCSDAGKIDGFGMCRFPVQGWKGPVF